MRKTNFLERKMGTVSPNYIKSPDVDYFTDFQEYKQALHKFVVRAKEFFKYKTELFS